MRASVGQQKSMAAGHCLLSIGGRSGETESLNARQYRLGKRPAWRENVSVVCPSSSRKRESRSTSAGVRWRFSPSWRLSENRRRPRYCISSAITVKCRSPPASNGGARIMLGYRHRVTRGSRSWAGRKMALLLLGIVAGLALKPTADHALMSLKE